MTTTLEAPTALDLRAELQQLVLNDLLGPAGGPEEEVAEANVRGRYVLGLLAPQGQTFIPDEEDDLATSGADTDQDGKSDTITPQQPSMLPSSMGLTFTIEQSTEALEITARWGRYHRVRSETALNKAGEEKLVWKREPVEAVSEPILLREGRLDVWHPEPGNEEVYVTGLCRARDDAWTVTLFLVNGQQEPAISKDEAWLFQPELAVRAHDGAPVFVKRALPAALNHLEPEDRAMQMIYRRTVEFAVGHSVAIHVEQSPDSWDRAVGIRTTIVPAYEVERMDPPTPQLIPQLGEVELDMKRLSELSQGDYKAALQPLVDAYSEWIDTQESRIDEEADLQTYAESARMSIRNCREARDRIEAGIDLLDANPQAAAAFAFANQAMYQQRIHSIYAGQVQKDAQPVMDSIDQPPNRSWRPFQLAFVLLTLPDMTDPTRPSRSDPSQAIADLLWFPTGGGKTEAYLGVAAFTMGIRRLQGDLGGLGSEAGVTVLMRYTLRLLTLDQFQRAATLIAACELIRRKDESVWGKEPFRIGLWVGQRSTPNWTKDAAEATKRSHGEWNGAAGRGTPYQLTHCPWCGQPIDPGKNIRVETPDEGRGRTFQYCSDPLGSCPFSFKQSPNEGLPIIVVDEEIYRRLPTLLIATVDKFAQMPWKGATQMLFGRVDGYCPRHGFRSPEIEDSDSHPKRQYFPAVKTEPRGPLRPPDLIIQDELHLISGPLGTLVGLYETAVDKLCTWELNGQQVRPKVIASTATIRRSQNQVNSLFLRDVRVFHPAVLDADDNFFSRRNASSNKSPGRLYIGVCAPGTRMRTILLRVYVAYMSAAQTLFEKYGEAADPYMTLVGYFNSMRELGGMRRVADDSLRTRLMRMDSRGLARRSMTSFGVEELTSRKGATDIPKIRNRLDTPFVPGTGGKKKSKDKSEYPLDVVLATNMISVGIDIGRLGLMVVASQPKATAEYIQATSRVGRVFPGIVCTVYNWARPRDLSHYERFEHYHATFYQQVEALSVTPFSPRALDRGLSGVLVSYVRLMGEDYNPNANAGQLQRQHAFVDTTLADLGRRAGMITGQNQVQGLVKNMLDRRLDEWLSRAQATTGGAILGYTAVRDGRTLGLLSQPTTAGRDLFVCLNSLRDVEPSVKLILRDQGMDYEPSKPSADEGAKE
jgi:hypothetical protein